MTLVDTVAVGDNMGTVTATDGAIAVDHRYVAHNYSPLPVVAASADGAWITDIEGHRYLDCLAAYSAVNFGHRNPEITAVAHAQLDSVTLVESGVSLRPAGPVLRGVGRTLRQGHGAADEQRRRGGGKRHQGCPQVGHRRQASPRGRGKYRRGTQQLPRPLVPARAYENQVYVAYANYCGHENGLEYCGLSCVAAPDGSDAARAGRKEELIICELDHGLLTTSRRTATYLADRRPQLYAALSTPTPLYDE